MMNVPTRHDLKVLLQEQDDLRVSIYMPTRRAGREIRQNPIRFKNRLKRAEAGLWSAGLRVAEIEELLAPARRLQGDPLYWQHPLRSRGSSLLALQTPQPAELHLNHTQKI